MVADLAAQIARAGNLPIIDVLVVDGPAPTRDDTSATRVDKLASALRLLADVELPRGPLLLVDDAYRTGWTMTVAAALLRDAGASAVLPVVVHQLP